MADQFDKAQDLDALAVQSALALQAKKAANAPRFQPIGCCLNPRCGEEFTEPARLFCNPQCEREHARRAA